jgi:hypothetical protein
MERVTLLVGVHICALVKQERAEFPVSVLAAGRARSPSGSVSLTLAPA